MSENVWSYKETLLGKIVQLNESVPDGFIRMNRQTWEEIKVVAFRNSVTNITEVSTDSPRT